MRDGWWRRWRLCFAIGRDEGLIEEGMLVGWVGYWIVESRSVSGRIMRCLGSKSVHYSTSQQERLVRSK